MEAKIKHVRPCCSSIGADVSYFGEFRQSGKERIPCGTGFYYNLNDDSYIMCESIENGVHNGMYFVHNNRDFVTNAGYMVNDVRVGPRLEYNSLSSKRYVALSYFDKNGVQNGPQIIVTPNDEYIVAQYKAGKFTGKVIHFKNGRFLLEIRQRLLSPGRVLDVIDCGWEFQFSGFSEGAKYFSRANFAARPALVKTIFDKKTKETSYEYIGGVQCAAGKLKYVQNKYDERTFVDEVDGFAIYPTNYNQSFFGSVASLVGKKGAWAYHGIGCMRQANGRDWEICNYNFGKRFGETLTYDGTFYTFGAYDGNEERDGVEFELSDFTFKITSQSKRRKYSYLNYVVDLNTFDVLVDNGETPKTHSFSAVNTTALSKIKLADDAISPEKRAFLNQFNLEYRVEAQNLAADPKIFITGSRNRQGKDVRIFIPKFVEGIDEKAFKGMKNVAGIEISDGVKRIGEGVCEGCVKLHSLTLPNTLEVVEKNVFKSTDLGYVEFPESVRLIRSGSFIGCKSLKYAVIKNADCVVEEGAFPKTCSISNSAINEQLRQDRLAEEEQRISEKVEQLREKRRKKEEKRDARAIKRMKDVDDIEEALKPRPSSAREKGRSFGGGALNGVLGVLAAIIDVILFIPKQLLRLIVGDEDNGASNLICVLLLLISAATLILGFTDNLRPIHDYFSKVANESVPSLFGFKVINAFSGVVSNAFLNNELVGILLGAFYLVVAPFDLLLNALVLVLVIICFLLYVLYGALFIYGLGALLIIPAIIALTRAENKALPAFTLIVSVVITIIYYVMIGTFYFA